jgi:hypothetical protein
MLNSTKAPGSTLLLLTVDKDCSDLLHAGYAARDDQVHPPQVSARPGQWGHACCAACLQARLTRTARDG